MPVLMGPERLDETGTLLRRLAVEAVEATRGPQHPERRRRTHCDNIVVEHHEAQAAIAIEGMSIEVVDDRTPLPWLDPMVSRDLAVMLVRPAVVLLPLVELAAGYAKPGNESLRRKLSLRRPLRHEVQDLVSGVRSNPSTRQGSPRLFFSRTNSSEISAITLSFFASFASSASTLLASFSS